MSAERDLKIAEAVQGVAESIVRRSVSRDQGADRISMIDLDAIIASIDPEPVAVPDEDAEIEKQFNRMGDSEGQGLHPYFKDAYRKGWHARAKLAAAPQPPQSKTEDIPLGMISDEL